jgi:hypothetical protein
MKFILAMLLSLFMIGCAHAPSTVDSDLDEMAVALVQSQLTSGTSYMHQNGRLAFFISIGGQDISAAAATRLTAPGTTILPSSAWIEGKGMRMDIGLPELRPDGDFDVGYAFYCGIRCASTHQAVMRHDEHGWSFIASKMLMISHSSRLGYLTGRAQS